MSTSSRFDANNQKGIAQILLLVLLVGGLIGGVYAVQKARTVLKPRASEGDPTSPSKNNQSSCDGGYERCDNGTAKRVRYVWKDIDESGQPMDGFCSSKEEEVGSCDEFFCGGSNTYCDNGRRILETGGYWDPNKEGPNKCVYDYQDKGSCVGTDENDVPFDTTKSPVSRGSNSDGSKAGNYCEPGVFDPSSCTVCNANGTTYNAEGTDWGKYEENPMQWCICARKYSEKTQGLMFNTSNYPQCDISKNKIPPYR